MNVYEDGFKQDGRGLSETVRQAVLSRPHKFTGGKIFLRMGP